jgi:hypothetical protein
MTRVAIQTPGGTEGESDYENDVSAEKTAKEKGARFSQTDENHERPQCPEAQETPGPQKAFRIAWRSDPMC